MANLAAAFWIPAFAGMTGKVGRRDFVAWFRIAYLVRIRICGIIGFSGFYHLVFDRQAPVPIHLGEIYGYGENRKMGETKS